MHRIFASLILFCATFIVAPLAASAAPITVPSGLNPGDQYRLAFVTSTTRDATSSNIADYNAFVTTAANSVPALAALGATWKAIASTSIVDARDNTGTNPSSFGVPIYTLADALIASSNVDLWDGSILNPITMTEIGINLFGYVWTGSDPGGFAYTTFPLGGANFSIIGAAGLPDSRWVTYTSNGPLSSRENLYALSGVLTVVPEPSSLVLAGFGIVGLLFAARHRRRQTNQLRTTALRIVAATSPRALQARHRHL